MSMSTELAVKRRLTAIIAEYEAKRDAIPAQLAAYEEACTAIKDAACIRGTYGRTNIDVRSVYDRTLYSALLKSAWYNLYEEMKLDILMSAKDRKLFEQSMSDPAPFTVDNIRSTFGDFVLDPRATMLRGLAEVFCDLDPSYKSHDKVKIGVEGLPKRVIMSGFGSFTYWGWERLADVVNAVATIQSKPHLSYFEIKQLIETAPEKLEDGRGMSLKIFKNGNGHLHFSPEVLRLVNLALAEYYGDVLADCHEPKPEDRRTSTEVSKDLQYYPTPTPIVEKMLGEIYIREGELVLEPSCGCGRIMDGIAKTFKGVTCHGIEFDADRAEEARRKGHRVLTANFLETEPTPKYDRVIMNPPFYGKHYAKHVNHALKFLKEGGTLTAILPITARYDHGLLEGRWSDLPVGAFAASGTNINTTVLTIHK